MKKLLFSVIAFALITLSCNKYKDDFANLNARIDALAAQVQGVAGLQTSITAIQGQLTSLSTAVAAIPNNTAAITALTSGLATLTTTVGNIQTALNTLATNVAAGNVTTQGLITTLTNQLATNQAAITAAFNAITALATSNQTALMTSLNSIITSQTALTTALGTLSTQSAAIKALVDALTVNLATANLNIQILLQNSQFYEGSLNIFDEATLAFAETLQDRIALVKGNVTINTTALSAAQKTRLDVVAGKMLSVIGNFTYVGAGTTFGQLGSVSGDVTFTVTGNVNIPALTSVGKSYTVSGNDITDGALATVGGAGTYNVKLDYDGGYSNSSLTTVSGNIWLNNYTTGGSVVGTTTVNLPALSSAGNLTEDGVYDGTVSFGSASSVNIGAGMLTSLTAAKATTVRLGQARYSGSLAVSASTTAASSINLAALDSTTGNLSVTGFTASTVDLSNYRNGAGGTLAVSSGYAALNLPKYSYGTISGPNVKTLTAAMYRMSSTKAGAATDFAGLPILENLTVGAAEYGLFSAGVANTIKTIDYTGNGVSAEFYLLADETALTTLKVGGNLPHVGQNWFNGGKGGVALDNLPGLTSITTSGIINNFVMSQISNLTSLSLGHTHQVGGPGSFIWIQICNNLTGIKTSTDFAKSLAIINNTKLANIDLGSYTNTILGGPIEVLVYGNKTTGTYTPAVSGTATTARIDPKYTSTSLHMSQMKTYLSKFTGVPFAPLTATTAATATFTLGIDDVDPTAGVQTLDAAMTADAVLDDCDAFNLSCYPANVATSHVNTPTELIKFQ